MRRAVTLLIIIVASFVVAALLSPPDPFYCLLHGAGILCVAIPSYIAGLRHARRLVGTHGGMGPQDAANAE